MQLFQYPRISFAHLPTPLEPLANLSKQFAGPNLWIKRDDCTGLGGGGNKTRKLEFLMADALQRKADTIITHGATQSNHARQTAAIAAKLNLQCHLLLEARVSRCDLDYEANGNVFLDRLYGAGLHPVAADTDMESAMLQLADRLQADGRKPYVMPGGGSNATGAIGYANCAMELLHQAESAGIAVDLVVHATGSAGTQAGLVAGFACLGRSVPVLGIGVRAPRKVQEERVFDLAAQTAERLGAAKNVTREQVVANCNYVGKGYGIPSRETIEAIKLFAREESILLDPVYTGKAAAGLVDLMSTNAFRRLRNIVFIHTGGSQALFGYRNAFNFDSDPEPANTYLPPEQESRTS